ncbi:hypothetical protein K7432_018378 [Basidiobolus ranarum]|uniref:2Fe-2S ferredoxin-type domain-containing protein n=1 Tax=Basidiobolus ranarum TaxID=34480 RepID=A0ABR2VJF6_9FUNG
MSVQSYSNTLTFYVNGTRVALQNPDPEMTLLQYLRGTGLTGTKLGCGEGGCGKYRGDLEFTSIPKLQ